MIRRLGRRHVRAADIAATCVGSGLRSVTFIGGRIEDSLDLAWSSGGPSIEFVETTFDAPILLTNAVMPSITFRRCRINAGVDANGIEVEGDVNLEGSTITGAIATTASISRQAAIWMCEASIGGRLLAVGTTITAETPTGSRHEARALQADRLVVSGNIRFVSGFTARGEVRLIGAKLGGSLDLTSCDLFGRPTALDLSEADIGGSLYLLRDPEGMPPVVSGTIDADGVRVRGQTVIIEAAISGGEDLADPAYYRLTPDGSVASLRAPSAVFAGAVHVDRQTTIDGLVDLAGARFGSHLDFGDSQLGASCGYALDLINADVAGDLTLAASSNSIRLANTHVGGSLFGLGASIKATDGSGVDHVVAGRGLSVDGDLDFNNLTTTGGTLDLRLVRIVGDLRLRGAQLSNPSGQTLALTSARIGASTYLDEGFCSRGNLRLDRCVIGGRLVCDGGSFVSPTPSPEGGIAFEAIGCSAEAGMFLGWHLDGRANLTNARTSILGDHHGGWGEDYVIAGLIYTRFSRRHDDAADVDKRLEWIAGQDVDDSATYEQLAGYYRNHGRMLDAETVLIERNRHLRRQRATEGGWKNKARNATDRMWEITVGYGYRSSRAAVALVILVLLVSGVLLLPTVDHAMRAVDEDNVVYSPEGPLDEASLQPQTLELDRCGNGRIRCFNPFFYAIDTVVPLLDLQQRSTWYPDQASPSGRIYSWVLNIAVLLGWAASSLLVLGVTNAVNPGKT